MKIMARELRDGDMFRVPLWWEASEPHWSSVYTATGDAFYYDEVYTVRTDQGESFDFTYDDIVDVFIGYQIPGYGE